MESPYLKCHPTKRGQRWPYITYKGHPWDYHTNLSWSKCHPSTACNHGSHIKIWWQNAKNTIKKSARAAYQKTTEHRLSLCQTGNYVIHVIARLFICFLIILVRPLWACMSQYYNRSQESTTLQRLQKAFICCPFWAIFSIRCVQLVCTESDTESTCMANISTF